MMRLRKFEIHNFKGIRQASFEWDDIIILIGENNVGKSTVLQALDYFLSGTQIRDETLFNGHLTDADHAIELVGWFDHLSDTEKEATAVQGRMHGEQWILKKRFWREKGDTEAEPGRWNEQYYSFSSQEVFTEWPASDNTWGNFPTEYQALIEQMPDRGTRPNAQSREALKQLVRTERPDLIHPSEPSWVPNPGGGGSWKSNANSIIPRYIPVKAVQDATDEAVSKEASTYGKIVSLIVEKKMMKRPEVVQLRDALQTVLKLFQPDPDHPEAQAEEIQELEQGINARLNEVIQGVASIRITGEPDLRPVLLPSTTLVLQDQDGAIETQVRHQGHGLQRTLIMTLLQILAELEGESVDVPMSGDEARAVVLAVEEPELYMHPQMERKMRDLLYKLAAQRTFQVICTTHSPVFLDMAEKHKSIVRVVKDAARHVTFFQVKDELFSGQDGQSERYRLQMTTRFDPAVNEVFFTKRVVLLEEDTALVAFERAAEITGVFTRHPEVRRDVIAVSCNGKGNIPAFQQVLNHFDIPYTVVYDEDQGNLDQQKTNARIDALLGLPNSKNKGHMISPTNLEGVLGYPTPHKDKPYHAAKQVEALAARGALPPDFMRALNLVYFGQNTEPA